MFVSPASAEMIGGADDAPAFCAAPSGGANSISDSDCAACDGYSKCTRTDGTKFSKCGQLGEAECTSAATDTDEDSYRSSCNGDDETDELDSFLGGLDEVHYACGCLTYAN